MNIHVSDVNHPTTTNSDPGGLYPFACDVPVDQDVKVRIPVLLEFENSYVLRSNSVLALQVDPQLGEDGIQIANGIALNLRGIKR